MTSRMAVCFALLVTVSGCQTTQVAQPPPGYPAEITGIGESRNFPSHVGPYVRGKLIMYAPGMTDHSVGYDRYDGMVRNAVTLYFYPAFAPIPQQYAAEKQEILRAHAKSALVTEKNVVLSKGGASYTARVAVFQFDEVFAGQYQRLSSELILIELPSHLFKVRSTAPLDQVEAAEASMFTLLESVNWAY